MEARDIISIQMEYHFGIHAVGHIKDVVNAALSRGEWHEDFDIAVTPHELTRKQTEDLLGAVLNAYPTHVLDIAELRNIIDAHLPQAMGASIGWLVAPDCGLVLTDSLRVAKVAHGDLIWVTNRISWDGIELDIIENGVVLGSWFDATRSTDEWQPLELAYADGTLLKGKEINF